MEARSKTSDAVTAMRAYATDSPSLTVINDPYARKVLAFPWTLMSRPHFVAYIFAEQIYNRLFPNAMASILVRMRYAEDVLEELVKKKKVSQYLILGAGMNSFAWRRRDLANRLHIYEVDHPLTQAYKRQRFAQLGETLPDNLTFAAVDFARESLREGLKRTDFSNRKGTFVAWNGVTYYLTPDAIAATLKDVAHVCKSGSEIFFDYFDDFVFSDHDDKILHRLFRFVEKRGEPFRGALNAATIAKELPKHKLKLVKNLGPEEMAALYGKQLGRIGLHQYTYFCHARVNK